MSGACLFRQLIGQLQELLHFHGSPPSNPNYLIQLQPPPLGEAPPHHLRWLPYYDDPSIKDSWDLIMIAEKSENLKMMYPGKPPPAKRARKERNRGNIITTVSSINMEQEIWKEFPKDLFEAVIARVPIATFFKFQSVCKKFNSLLLSQSFSQECAQVPQTIPWFYTFTHEDVNIGAMYDPTLKKWHHPPVSALPTKFVLPVASAGGLICFLDTANRRFYVCNPLTRSFKELPARSVKVWSRMAVGMSLTGQSASEGYKILWVGCDGEYEVYDSDKNDWTNPGSMPSHIKIPLALNFRSQTVCIDSTLYFMRSDPVGVVSYNMVSGVWNQFIIPSPLHLRDPTLSEYGGKVMLVELWGYLQMMLPRASPYGSYKRCLFCGSWLTECQIYLAWSSTESTLD